MYEIRYDCLRKNGVGKSDQVAEACHEQLIIPGGFPGSLSFSLLTFNLVSFSSLVGWLVS